MTRSLLSSLLFTFTSNGLAYNFVTRHVGTVLYSGNRIIFGNWQTQFWRGTTTNSDTMLRLGVRSFAATARRAAETAAQMEGSNQYGIAVSKAQGTVKGLTGGNDPALL